MLWASDSNRDLNAKKEPQDLKKYVPQTFEMLVELSKLK